MADQAVYYRPSTIMAVQLGLAMCFAVFACLFQPTVSEHKKKIIVKVPHIIKHIHHDVYKPVHVHKVHAKKVEHHHEEHEGRVPKWKPKRGHGGKHKAHGSHSHLQPVMVHHDPQEGVEHRQGMEYGMGQEYGRGYDHRGHDYSQEAEDSLENYPEERRNRPIGDGEVRAGPNWEPIDMGGWFGGGKGKGSDEWLISSEDLRELREDYGILGGKSANGKKRKKDKPLTKKPVLIDMDKDGWKPMMEFTGWKDVEDLHNGYRGYRRDPFNYSGEEVSEESELELRDEEERIQQRNKPGKNSKKGKWSKQIEVREPSSEEDPTHRQRSNHPNKPLYQVQRPEETHVQLPPRKPWHDNEPKKWPETLPTPQARQWPRLTTPTPQSHPSSVVWSGHHLQTPQHTMWHVQQHNVQTPVQVLGSSNPPGVSVHPPPPPPPLHPLPLRPQLQKSQQVSASAPRVAAPSWPPTKRSPGVMQKWEQSVHMGDGAGPGSSYKVEVINYSKPQQ